MVLPRLTHPNRCVASCGAASSQPQACWRLRAREASGTTRDPHPQNVRPCMGRSLAAPQAWLGQAHVARLWGEWSGVAASMGTRGQGTRTQEDSQASPSSCLARPILPSYSPAPGERPRGGGGHGHVLNLSAGRKVCRPLLKGVSRPRPRPPGAGVPCRWAAPLPAWPLSLLLFKSYVASAPPVPMENLLLAQLLSGQQGGWSLRSWPGRGAGRALPPTGDHQLSWPGRLSRQSSSLCGVSLHVLGCRGTAGNKTGLPLVSRDARAGEHGGVRHHPRDQEIRPSQDLDLGGAPDRGGSKYQASGCRALRERCPGPGTPRGGQT